VLIKQEALTDAKGVVYSLDDFDVDLVNEIQGRCRMPSICAPRRIHDWDIDCRCRRGGVGAAEVVVAVAVAVAANC
jgi:hypothetical protein